MANLSNLSPVSQGALIDHHTSESLDQFTNIGHQNALPREVDQNGHHGEHLVQAGKDSHQAAIPKHDSQICHWGNSFVKLPKLDIRGRSQNKLLQ